MNETWIVVLVAGIIWGFLGVLHMGYLYCIFRKEGNRLDQHLRCMECKKLLLEEDRRKRNE